MVVEHQFLFLYYEVIENEKIKYISKMCTVKSVGDRRYLKINYSYSIVNSNYTQKNYWFLICKEYNFANEFASKVLRNVNIRQNVLQ